MANMMEIRFHGRGGQGAKSAGDILAAAAFNNGKNIQAFPEYGSERKGAPVRSYVRISDDEIRVHSGITDPDIVLVLDETLIESEKVDEGLKMGGTLIVNSARTPEKIKDVVKNSDIKYFTVDANALSTKHFGKAFPNAPMLAVFAATTKLLPLPDMIESFKKYFGKKLSEEMLQKNIDVMNEAAKEVKSL